MSLRSIPLYGLVTIEGRPVSDAVVELYNREGDVLTQSRVDNEGRFTFFLTTGIWMLRAWDGHGHRGRTEVNLEEEPGNPTHIALR